MSIGKGAREYKHREMYKDGTKGCIQLTKESNSAVRYGDTVGRKLESGIASVKRRSKYMGSDLLRVVQEQQKAIEQQSRFITDLITTLES